MKISKEQPKILVIGSSSVDLVLNTSQHLKAGETIMAKSSENYFGGKGANQAVGTSRLGASTYFIGRVGMDPYGQQILRHLVDEGVNVGFVSEDPDHATGTAYVMASEDNNAIVVVPSANYNLQPKHIKTAERLFETADLVLVQLEITDETIDETLKLCKKYNTKLGIYAAPARPLKQELIDYATFIIAKSNDLPLLFGENNRERILHQLNHKLLVRDGVNSTLYYNGEEMVYHRNEPEQKAHRMGMGDAFTSGFSIALVHGNSISEAVKFGNLVSLKVTLSKGSQTGLPFIKDLKIY